MTNKGDVLFFIFFFEEKMLVPFFSPTVDCLEVRLRLLFMLKCIKMIFFIFFKIIFKISASKRSKTYKKINF